MNSERELLRELLKKEEQPWSVKRQLWKKGKKKEANTAKATGTLGIIRTEKKTATQATTKDTTK